MDVKIRIDYNNALDKSCIKNINNRKKAKTKNEIFFKEVLTKEKAKEIYAESVKQTTHIFKTQQNGEIKTSLCWFPIYNVSGTASGTFFKERVVTGWDNSYNGYSYNNITYYKDVYDNASGSNGRTSPHDLISRILSVRGEAMEKPPEKALVYDDPDALASEISSAANSAASQARSSAVRSVESTLSLKQRWRMSEKELKIKEKQICENAANAAAAVEGSATVQGIEYMPFYIIEQNEFYSLVNAVSGEIKLEGDIKFNRQRIQRANKFGNMLKWLYFALTLGIFSAAGYFFFPLWWKWLEPHITNFSITPDPIVNILFSIIEIIVFAACAFTAIFHFFNSSSPMFGYSLQNQVQRSLNKLKTPKANIILPLLWSFIGFIIRLVLFLAIIVILYIYVLEPGLQFSNSKGLFYNK